MKRPRWRTLHLPFGVKVWANASDYEHPMRAAGIWIPGLGEFELIVTSPRTHPEPIKEPDVQITVGGDPLSPATVAHLLEISPRWPL